MKKENKLDFGVDLLASDPTKTVEMAKLAEKNGFDYFWVADVDFYSDVYIALTSAALATKRVKLGTGVTNPLTRHPVCTGIAISSLNAISNGRAVITLGTGDYHLMKSLNLLPEKPIRALREAVEIIRNITSNESFSFKGTYYTVPEFKMTFKNPSKIPIFIGGKGPMMLTLAGKIADGIFLDAIPVEVLPKALEYVKKGVKKVGRTLDDLYLMNVLGISIDEDYEKAMSKARDYAIFAVASIPPYIQESLGIEKEVIDRVRSKLPDLSAAATEIPLDVAEKFSIVGTPEACKKKIKKYAELGIKQIIMILEEREDVDLFLKLLKETIIDEFKNE